MDSQFFLKRGYAESGIIGMVLCQFNKFVLDKVEE